MARKCSLTGKRGLVGNNVSHSQRKTKRVQQPNLIKPPPSVAQVQFDLLISGGVSSASAVPRLTTVGRLITRTRYPR